MMESVKAINTSVSQRFEKQVKKFSDKIALQSCSRSITYSELNSYANQIAHTVLGIDDTPLVGTYFDNNIDSIAAILGILKSGKAYIPLNPRHKSKTIAQIIEGSQIKTIVTERKYSSSVAQNVALIDITSKRHNGDGNPAARVRAADSCCVIYTSGSTGEPKGVIHNHRNVLHTTEIYRKQLSIVPDDKILLLPHCSFSASLANVFVSLLSGATSFMFDIANKDLQDLPEELDSNKVTVFHSVPTIFLRLVDLLSPPESFTHIRLVLLGGESANCKHLELYKRHFPASKEFVVVYGATEAIGAVFFSTKHVQEYSPSRLPLGNPVEDFKVEIVDSNRNILPHGNSGEMRITSEFVSLGYFRNGKLTLESFEKMGNQRAYYTGDIGYFDKNGCLYHLCRKDSVTKISGQKVSLLDVEAHLTLHDSIREAVVLPHRDRDNSRSIVAYIVTRGALSGTELRLWLSELLSGYMIPAHFIRLSSMPLTPNGKIDRKALLSKDIPDRNQYTAPANTTERKLADIWQRVLKQDNIGVNDNFFDLGGDSVLAMMIVTRINEITQADLSISNFFEAPTIKSLSVYLQDR